MQNQISAYFSAPKASFGIRHSQLRSALLAVLLAVASFSLSAAGILKPGDILYTDSGDAINGGCVLKVNPRTGEKTVLARGGLLNMPFGVAMGRDGCVVVSDSGRLVRINPDTGEQRIIADYTRGLGAPYGIAVGRHGEIYAANAQEIVRVDPATGTVEVVSSGGSFHFPLAVACAPNGDLWVANVGFPSEIVRIDAQTGAQTVVSRGVFLKFPQAITVKGRDVYVSDVATSDGNFGRGRVIHIDARTGTQCVVAEGGHLIGPVGIAVDEEGHLIVGDPYTINLNSAHWYDGGIVRVNPVTGDQFLLARGRDNLVNPRGVTVVRHAAPAHHHEKSK
jgi:sugar lactone lactonase YvrE